MKKLLYIIISFCLLFSVGFAQQREVGTEDKTPTKNESSRKFEQSPVSILESVNGKANKNKANQVQDTKLNNVSSRCEDIPLDPKYTISRTLCNIKGNLKSYLDYIVYIGLTAATIFIIWNGFKLVTSGDRGKQMTEFRKNITYIIIGVVLLIGFYYIIDIFVSVVNLIVE